MRWLPRGRSIYIMIVDRKSFSRAQFSSFLGTVADYSVIFISKEIFGVWYPVATALGAFTGAVVNFLLNRHWSFHAAHEHFGLQAGKYALVSAGSLFLNVMGVVILTEVSRIHYAVSVILVSIVVGIFFNYPLHHWFVYRKHTQFENKRGTQIHSAFAPDKETYAENQKSIGNSRAQEQAPFHSGENVSGSRTATVCSNGRNRCENRSRNFNHRCRWKHLH